MKKIIALGSDHGGFVLKESITEAVKKEGYEVKDFGTFCLESVDYPDIARPVVNAVLNKEVNFGILLCGTGVGISIAANKFKGIRCALVVNEFCAQMAKEHNDANIISLGGRTTSPIEAQAIVKAYIDAEFAGGRHQTRIDKISEIENV